MIFLHIRGLTTTTQDTTGISSRVLASVQAQMESLSERAEYEDSHGKRFLLTTLYGEQRTKEIQALYRSCRSLPIVYGNEEISYNDLLMRIREISRDKQVSYIDVTAIKKRYLGDIVATCLIEALQHLYTFDLLGSSDFDKPWTMLIHDLKPENHYKYVNIIGTEIYRRCISVVGIRTPSTTVAAVITLVLLISFPLLAWRLGPESSLAYVASAAASVASLLSVAFVFLAPRR